MTRDHSKPARRSTFSTRRRAAALLAVAVAGGTVFTGVAEAAPAKADVAFYKGKTITWDVPSAPGASFYDSATILAPLVEKYLGATVNIVSIPAGATIAGQDQAAAASPNGLTLGDLNVSANISNKATNVAGINFDETKVDYVSGLPINPDVFVISPSESYKTWDALVKARPSSLSSADYAGSIDILQRAMYGAYGIKAKLVTGYSDVPDQVAGFLRGDTQLAANQVPAFASTVAGGKARPLLVTAPIPAGAAGYAQLKAVPDIAQYAVKNPPQTASGKNAIKAMETLFGAKAVNNVIFAPSGTPAPLVAALTMAFDSAQTSATAEAAFTKASLAPGYISPTQVAADITTGTKLEGAIGAAVSDYAG
jgi:tripartite-type tricarboxylate transporter receptor subunit TctC